MAIDFHSRRNRNTYAGRQADAGWAEAIRRIVDPTGKRVADIGCGGGIYSLAWREIGAARGRGRRLLREMVAAAREQAAGLAHYLLSAGRRRGDRPAVGRRGYRLPARPDPPYAKLRAVLRRSPPCARSRRTTDRPGSNAGRCPAARLARAHAGAISSSAFRDCWPSRPGADRPTRPCGTPCRQRVSATVESVALWEVRKTHDSRNNLAQDLASRTGRSILHDLSDSEIDELIAYIEARIPAAVRSSRRIDGLCGAPSPDDATLDARQRGHSAASSRPSTSNSATRPSV